MPGDELMARYVVEALIASGGMADVYRARDRRLDRVVAVKAFRIGTADARRFEVETRLLARLNHPNLVCVFDAGEGDGVPFIVLQHVEGQTLADRLTSGPLGDREARRLAVDVASALVYVHGQRIVHRDVKPSNILLEPDGRALLGDFGVAVLLDATRLTIDGSTIGTAAYLAPEQATGHAVDARADIYALGLVLLEALTGRVAFTGSLQEVVTAKLGRDPHVPPDLPSPWPGLLAAMTRRDPSQRPDAHDVLTVLAAPERAGATPAATRVMPASAMPAPPPPWRRPWLAAAALVAALVGLAAVAALVMALGSGGGSDGDNAPTSTSSVPAATETTIDRVAHCAALEAEKEALDDELRQGERGRGRGKGGDGDDNDDDDAKEAFEEAKDSIEDQKKAAGC